MSCEKVWTLSTSDNSSDLYKLENITNCDTYEYYSPSDNSSIKNLISLTYVNIPTIMHVIKERYKENNIYTYNGDIIISINPFQKIDIYSIQNTLNIEEDPHVYSLSEKAYKNIFKKNQSILVSGESGSGKTENTKYILNYLCHKYAVSSCLSSKIINSNYIIELFGNAKTIRNDNSSRFGKFIKLFINNNKIVGGHIENYLLEKSRISETNSAEKTYHIFYLVCQNNHILRKYGFKNISEYTLLNKSCYTHVNEEFNDVDRLINIFEQFSFDQKDIDSFFSKLRLILELLNCTSRELLKDILESMPFILSKLDITVDGLYNKLTEKEFIVNNECIKKQLDNNEMKVSIKTYCEDIYEDMFSIIISQISHQLGDVSENYIGILDIFGFEVFEKNGYEQLCINYTNEVLQQIFNEYIFKNEQLEYKKDNLDWEYIEYSKNDNICKLFNAPISIFSIINEQSILGSGTDKGIYSSFESNIKSDILKINNLKRIDYKFSIKHFTGEVEYTIDNFIRKNRISSRSSKVKTNLHYFTNQLQELKEELDSNQCYFIRCIKPNNQNKPEYFDQEKIYKQLLYSGIIEGIKIILKGYPVKKEKEQCITEFKYMSYYEKRSIIEYLIENNTPKEDFQIGTKKIFMKAPIYDDLYRKNIKYKEELATYIQKYIRRLICRKKFFYSLYFIIQIQSIIRKFISTKRVNRLRYIRSSIKINSHIRRFLLLKRYNIYKNATIINSYIRRFLCRQKYICQINHIRHNASIYIVYWFRRILTNRRIKKRSVFYNLSKEIEGYKKTIKLKDDELYRLNHILNKQSSEIVHLNELISKMDLSSKTLNNIINQDKLLMNNTEIDLTDNNINNGTLLNRNIVTNIDSENSRTTIFSNNIGQVVNDLYDVPLSSDSDIDLSLNEKDVSVIKRHHLEELGAKMERLYTELHDNKQMVQLMQTQYRVLLNAYQQERTKKTGWLNLSSIWSNST